MKTATSQELLVQEARNGLMRKQIAELAADGANDLWRLDIQYPDGEQTPLALPFCRWVTYADWRFFLYARDAGFAAARVQSAGPVEFGPHKHPTEETVVVLDGLLTDALTPNAIYGPVSHWTIPADTFHTPEVISDGCELVIYWQWPGNSTQPPGFKP